MQTTVILLPASSVWRSLPWDPAGRKIPEVLGQSSLGDGGQGQGDTIWNTFNSRSSSKDNILAGGAWGTHGQDVQESNESCLHCLQIHTVILQGRKRGGDLSHQQRSAIAGELRGPQPPQQALLNGPRDDRQHRDRAVGKDVGQAEPNSVVALQMAQLVGYHALHTDQVSADGRPKHLPSLGRFVAKCFSTLF